MTKAVAARHGLRRRRAVPLACLLVLLFPILVSACMFGRDGAVPWYEARRDATGLAPDPETHKEAVIQVYAARTIAWRGALAVHTWIVVKPEGAPRYTRWEVMGFGVANGVPAIRVDRTGPDNYWFGAMPEIVLDRRGPEAETLIPKIREAVESYPYPREYRIWPGPNSNTFTAHIARSVPELGLDLPPHAIGKDFITGGGIFAPAPSGTGWQVSLFGLAGILVARDEGVEVNLLGLTIGIDVLRPALKLPGIGRLGVARA